MKKKLNLFCVLILVLIVANIVLCFVFNATDFAQGFKDGYEEGAEMAAASGWSEMLLFVFLIPCVLIIVGAVVCFIRFILNVNRDKVFVWDNVKLLRLTGWGTVLPAVYFVFFYWYDNQPANKIFSETIDLFISAVFILIMSEVFAIGLKLKEEQDLTI